MNDELKKELVVELASRGFSPDGVSPNDSMTFGDGYLRQMDIVELLDLMVRRREKAARSADVVGLESATSSYNDANLAIDAIKAVLGRRTATEGLPMP